MDGGTGELRTEFEAAMKQATELKVALDQAEGRLPRYDVPHYSAIEDAAHEVGQMLSRMVQQRMLDEVVAEQSAVAKCPGCGTRCALEPRRRQVLSGDGRVGLQELVGHCPRCRRDFFPSA